VAWKAQVRLSARYRKLIAAGKPAPKVVVAIARELVGFIWAIAPNGGAEIRLMAALIKKGLTSKEVTRRY
jgi:hypothetical protein